MVDINIQHQLSDIQDRIKQSCRENKRLNGDIQLIAVSKKQPDYKIQSALEAGHRVFGENRVQEAYEHWQHRRDDYPDLKLHLIGPLQSNKVKDAVALFDVIHTIDREKIAHKIARETKNQGRDIDCFIQVNTGEEDQKSGIEPCDLNPFYHMCSSELKLNIIGLMCIPPVDDIAGFHFALLQKYAKALKLPHLSMGMSNDFETAIKYGASHIRVGHAIFGSRQ